MEAREKNKKFDEVVVQKLRDSLINNFNDFNGLYLFGSRVKGASAKESDYDFVALFENVNRDKKLKIYRIVGELEYEFNVFIDLKVLNPNQFKMNPFFYEEVTNYGIFYG